MSNFIFTPIEIIPSLSFFTFVEEENPIAARIAADYLYDPNHKNRPRGGGWEKTTKGWTTAKDSDVEFAFSPEVNVGGFDEAKTKENIERMKPKVSEALKKAIGKDVPFIISPKNAGRYLEYDKEKGMDVLYKEGSYSVSVNGITESEANLAAKELADTMFQSSVLVWNEQAKKSRLVFRNDEKFSGWDKDFGDKSVKLFVSGDTQVEDVEKIDDIIQLARKGKITGWTIAPVKQDQPVHVGGKDYIKMSSSITIHGLGGKDIEIIAKGLAKAFGKKVWLVDLKTKTERIVE